jgi:hypothetical protein
MTISQKTLIAAIAAAVTLSTSAAAAPNDLGTCLADNTSGKDRKELAKWIFVAMASHPELKDLSSVTDGQRDKINQAFAATVTRLLTESCVAQAKVAVQRGGPEAFKSAFGTLGGLAMQELMSNPQVSTSIGGFERYLDKKKLEALRAPN